MSAILGITDMLSRTSLDAEMHCSRKSTTFSICPVLRPINTPSKQRTSPCDAPPRCRQTQRLAFLLGAVLAVEHGAAVGALPANRSAKGEKATRGTLQHGFARKLILLEDPLKLDATVEGHFRARPCLLRHSCD